MDVRAPSVSHQTEIVSVEAQQQQQHCLSILTCETHVLYADTTIYRRGLMVHVFADSSLRSSVVDQ